MSRRGDRRLRLAEAPPDVEQATPDEVPGRVLEELLVAFHDPSPSPPSYDFDDPSIDRILGLEPPADDPAPTASQSSARPTTTIVIADDELPDPSYLVDGDLVSGDRGGAGEIDAARVAADRLRPLDEHALRSTIVISDLDESGSIEQLPARSSGSMDPRLRARRVAVRRAEGRRRLWWVAAIVAVMLLAVGAVAVLGSSVFDVEDVDVQGAVYTDPERLAEVIASLVGESTLLVDTRAAERTLEEIPWVERAKVRADFPHRVVIDIRERRAVATFAGSDGRFRVIDREGRVLDVLDGNPVAYMLLTGIAPDAEGGQFAGGIYTDAARLVVSLPDEIRAVTESVGVDSATGVLTMALDGGIAVRLGDASDLPTKLARLLQVIREPKPGMTRIDVSTPEVSIA